MSEQRHEAVLNGVVAGDQAGGPADGGLQREVGRSANTPSTLGASTLRNLGKVEGEEETGPPVHQRVAQTPEPSSGAAGTADAQNVLAEHASPAYLAARDSLLPESGGPGQAKLGLVGATVAMQAIDLRARQHDVHLDPARSHQQEVAGAMTVAFQGLSTQEIASSFSTTTRLADGSVSEPVPVVLAADESREHLIERLSSHVDQGGGWNFTSSRKRAAILVGALVEKADAAVDSGNGAAHFSASAVRQELRGEFDAFASRQLAQGPDGSSEDHRDFLNSSAPLRAGLLAPEVLGDGIVAGNVRHLAGARLRRPEELLGQPDDPLNPLLYPQRLTSTVSAAPAPLADAGAAEVDADVGGPVTVNLAPRLNH